MNDKYGVLFVCTGNTCRSPMAEGIFREKLPERLKSKVEVSSAGILAIEGSHPAEFAITATSEHGANISTHAARRLDSEILSENNIVFCMAQGHFDFIAEKFPAYRENVFLLKQFAQKNCGDSSNIADPIGGDLQDYRECLSIIEHEIDRILPQLSQLIDASL